MGHFKHAVWDNFLPEDVHQGLMQHALNAEGLFQSSRVCGPDASNSGAVLPERRVSWVCQDGLGPWRNAFQEAIGARELELFEALAIKPFRIAGMELELVAHRDGSFFSPHTDLRGGHASQQRNSDRVISSVYYFHTHPKMFTDGELAFLPIGKGEPLLVEPADNRLVSFPSVAPHAVQRVDCPGNVFSHSRFAVNCWLHRAGPATPELSKQNNVH